VNDEERAAEIAGRWRERMELGESVDLDAVVGAHPELAAPLRDAFAALRGLDTAFRDPDDDAPRAPSRVGRTIGPYRLDAELGSGGMGTVYLATVERRADDPAEAGTTNERVAVKVLHPHLVARGGFRTRLVREAEIGRRVRHENVVRTFEALQAADGDERLHLVVMEYVEGRTLRTLLDELGCVPEELCRHVGREIARALVAIHGAGALHRDLKPENVIISRSAAPGRDHLVKVMDLGVARLLDEPLRVSQTGAFVGSVRYAAPEQFGRPVRRSATSEASSAEVDGRADLYSLGLTLYELATGSHPFAGDAFHVVLQRQLTETLRPAGELNPQLSPFFEELLARLVEKDRGNRIASAAELVEILDAGEESSWWRERRLAIRAATHRPPRRIRIPRETALYGRDAELAKLRALYEKAKSGDGQVLLIEGEAGIGKSRLVDEFVGLLQRGFVVPASAGTLPSGAAANDPPEGGTTNQAEDMNFLYGSYPPGGAATASGAFTSAYREHLGDDEASIRAALPQTPLLAPAFAALLRGDVAPESAEKLTKDSLQTVFVHATRSFAATRTTIVFIDDLHFATEEGRALFASLAMAVPGHRVLLVGGARPSIDEKWAAGLARLPQATRIPLARLSPENLVRLLADSLGSTHLAEELAGKIATKSDGNPFFVFEILRGLRDGRFLTRKPDGTWATTQRIAEIEVPGTVKDLIIARVANLSTAERNLLDVAACAGFEFDPVLVGEVLSVGRIAVLQRLAAVEKSHRLVRSVGRRFVFDHHQVAEVLYAALPEMLREEYHAAIGAAIEARSGAASTAPKDLDGALCVELAEHYLKGARGDRALRYLDAALTHLEKGWLNEAAFRLADRALAVPGLVAGRERCEVLLRKAARLDLLGRRDAQREALEEAREFADAEGDAVLRGRVLRLLGFVHWRQSGHDEARALLGEALALVRAAGDLRGEIDTTASMGIVVELQGRLAEAREHHERNLALSREIGYRSGELAATSNVGRVLRNLGRLKEAREHQERCIALSREIGSRRGEANAVGNLGLVLWGLGRFEEARQHQERDLALCREIGDRHGEAASMANLGSLSWSLGRLGHAREYHGRALALCREIGDRYGEVMAMGNLGVIFRSLGRLAQARENFERRLVFTREIRDRLGEGFTLLWLADLAGEEGDAAEAERLYAEGLRVRREIGHRDGEAQTLAARGVHLARLGREAEARADLDAALALARELSLPGVELIAAAQFAALPNGELTPALAALAAYQGNATVEEAMHARFLLWQATHDLAHLDESKRQLDFIVEHAPADCRESMLANVRVYREITAAAREQRL
jgi:serine/threonine protein kinase/tetratricopeptide (TPR) repeat protein